MKFKRRNSIVPLALECVLLFMALSVFGWGLQAKLSLYHTKKGESASASSVAKLLTEKSSAKTVSVDNRDQRRPIWESQHFRAVVFSLLGHDVVPVNFSHPEPGPRNPGLYNLHGPDHLHRPPPVLS